VARPASVARTLRIAPALQRRADRIIAQTDRICDDRLDAEYKAFARKLVGRIGRKRGSPLAYGEERVWVGAVLFTVGRYNFLFEGEEEPHMTRDELGRLTGVPARRMAEKSKKIRDFLKLGEVDGELMKRKYFLAIVNPFLVKLDGLIVDVRELAPEVQEEAVRRGLVPPVPPPPGEGTVYRIQVWDRGAPRESAEVEVRGSATLGALASIVQQEFGDGDDETPRPWAFALDDRPLQRSRRLRVHEESMVPVFSTHAVHADRVRIAEAGLKPGARFRFVRGGDDVLECWLRLLGTRPAMEGEWEGGALAASRPTGPGGGAGPEAEEE